MRLEDQSFGGQKGEADEVAEFQQMRATDDDGSNTNSTHIQTNSDTDDDGANMTIHGETSEHPQTQQPTCVR